MTSSHEPQGALGLIGGLGVGAPVLYYQRLVEIHKARGLTPRLLIVHANVDRVLAAVSASRLDDLAQYLADLANQLAAAGATLCAIPAITPHICIDAIVARSKRPFVSLLDA